MKEIIKNIFEKVDINRVIATCYLITAAFTFIPNGFFENLGLLEFKINYETIISLIFVFISCYYLVHITIWIKDLIIKKVAIKRMRAMFEYISNEEKDYLMSFYDIKNRRLGLTCEFDYTDVTVLLLEKKGIIGRGQVSKGFFNFEYFLQSWAANIINKKIKEKKIIINIVKSQYSNNYYQDEDIEYQWE